MCNVNEAVQPLEIDKICSCEATPSHSVSVGGASRTPSKSCNVIAGAVSFEQIAHLELMAD